MHYFRANIPADAVNCATVDSRSIYAVNTRYGAIKIVNATVINVCSDGRPRTVTSGRTPPLIAIIAEVLNRIAGSATINSVWDSCDTSFA